jgi:hypothetical protein
MNILFVIFVLFSQLGTVGVHQVQRPDGFEPNIIIEDGVFMGGQLPMWGEICTATGVYGDPYGLSESLYSVSVGQVVSLHELSADGRPWVMIEKARWIPLSAVCPWGE